MRRWPPGCRAGRADIARTLSARMCGRPPAAGRTDLLGGPPALWISATTASASFSLVAVVDSTCGAGLCRGGAGAGRCHARRRVTRAVLPERLLMILIAPWTRKRTGAAASSSDTKSREVRVVLGQEVETWPDEALRVLVLRTVVGVG